jgi:hypothetical protein
MPARDSTQNWRRYVMTFDFSSTAEFAIGALLFVAVVVAVLS